MTGLAAILVLLAVLQAKHALFDFALQTSFMWQNKGRYGHPGGLLHAGLHALGTFVALLVFVVDPLTALVIAVAEFVLHYHIDWAKEGLTARFAPTPNTATYWALFGLDQALHQWTYLAIVWLVAG